MSNRAPFQNVTAVTMQLMLVLCFCALVSAQQANGVTTQDGKTAPGVEQGLDLDFLISRMTAAQAANHGQVKEYTVVRQYTLRSGNNENSDSKVVAEVSYAPPARKEYEIRETIGSGRGEKVVRRVLDHEVDTKSDWHTTAVTADNYEFQMLGREQSQDCNCYVLGITPKREAKDLIRGKVYVDPASFQIRRMAGELVKSPSWWVKRVNVTLKFNDVKGMWLQTAGYADADVRIVGRHVLETHDIEYRTQDMVASKVSPQRDSAVVRTGARNNAGAPRGRTSTIPVLGTSVVMGPR
jgi:hypothetical protein